MQPVASHTSWMTGTNVTQQCFDVGESRTGSCSRMTPTSYWMLGHFWLPCVYNKVGHMCGLEFGRTAEGYHTC